MRLVSMLVWVFALVVSPLVACNEVIEEPPTAALTYTVKCCARSGDDREPLEGARLCQLSTTNCALTNAAGVATIDVPADQEIAYTVEKKGYKSFLLARVIPADGYQGAVNERTDRQATELYERVESPYPMRGTGSILVNVSFEGATFDLVSATGKPFYNDEEGLWTLDLTATTSWGMGGFVEVTPGEHHVEFGGTAERCVPTGAWPGDVENSIRIPVREGYLTIASARCPPP